MAAPVTTAFLDKFADAWNAHDVEMIVSMMTEDAVMFSSAGPFAAGEGMQGRAALRAGIAELFAAMPDARWNSARHFLHGDRGVTEWIFTATRPDGSAIKTPGCDVFTFRDGLIAVKDSFRKQPTY